MLVVADSRRFDDMDRVSQNFDRASETDRSSVRDTQGVATGRSTTTAPVPRVALSREEAAAALGISLDSFERHVAPDVKLIRRGRLRLVPVGELERWATEQAEHTRPRP
jgi:hypothetical protein